MIVLKKDRQILRYNSCGFTLVELIVIMAIISVLVAITGMSLFSWMGRSDLKRASRTIASMCQSARVEAIKRNTDVAIIVDNATQACSLYTNSGDGDWATQGDNTRARVFMLSSLRSNIVISGLTKSIYVFTGKGRLNPPSGTITLENEAGETIDISVRISGSVFAQ